MPDNPRYTPATVPEKYVNTEEDLLLEILNIIRNVGGGSGGGSGSGLPTGHATGNVITYNLQTGSWEVNTSFLIGKNEIDFFDAHQEYTFLEVPADPETGALMGYANLYYVNQIFSPNANAFLQIGEDYFAAQVNENKFFTFDGTAFQVKGAGATLGFNYKNLSVFSYNDGSITGRQALTFNADLYLGTSLLAKSSALSDGDWNSLYNIESIQGPGSVTYFRTNFTGGTPNGSATLSNISKVASTNSLVNLTFLASSIRLYPYTNSSCYVQFSQNQQQITSNVHTYYFLFNSQGIFTIQDSTSGNLISIGKPLVSANLLPFYSWITRQEGQNYYDMNVVDYVEKITFGRQNDNSNYHGLQIWHDVSDSKLYFRDKLATSDPLLIIDVVDGKFTFKKPIYFSSAKFGSYADYATSGDPLILHSVFNLHNLNFGQESTQSAAPVLLCDELEEGNAKILYLTNRLTSEKHFFYNPHNKTFGVNSAVDQNPYPFIVPTIISNDVVNNGPWTFNTANYDIPNCAMFIVDDYIIDENGTRHDMTLYVRFGGSYYGTSLKQIDT